jgi:hypothetical protein
MHACVCDCPLGCRGLCCILRARCPNQPHNPQLEVLDPGTVLMWVFGSILALLWLLFICYGASCPALCCAALCCAVLRRVVWSGVVLARTVCFAEGRPW